MQEEEGTVRISRAAPVIAPAAVQYAAAPVVAPTPAAAPAQVQQLRQPHQPHRMSYQAILYVLQWWERSIAASPEAKHSLKWGSL